MNYKQLQASLKGQTTIKLNSKREVLQAEYDRLFLNGSFCELTCELPTVAHKPTPKKVVQTPSVKVVHPAQAASESKRQLSQAPRHRTPVADKYVNKKEKATVTPIKKVECKFSTEPKSEYFVNVNHKRFTDTLGSTEKQALVNLQTGLRIVGQVAKGFVQQSFRKVA